MDIEDEDTDILLLLWALARSFENFKDTMLYGKEVIVTSRKSKRHITKSKNLKVDDSGEDMSV